MSFTVAHLALSFSSQNKEENKTNSKTIHEILKKNKKNSHLGET